MEEFWKAGYDRASVASLTRSMGISAPSLYAAFGDKEHLFRAAVKRYVTAIERRIVSALEQENVVEAVQALLRTTAEGLTDEQTPPGCFMLSEPRLGPEREHVRRLVEKRLVRGQESGQLISEADPAALSRFVLSVMVGMSSCVRDGGEIDGIFEGAMQAVAAAARDGQGMTAERQR